MHEKDLRFHPSADYSKHLARGQGPPRGNLPAELALAEKKQEAEALAEVLESEWFGRAWVFQEIVLPPLSKLIIPEFDYRSTSSVNIKVSLQHLLDLSNRAHTRNIDRGKQHLQTLCEMYDRWERQHEQTKCTPPIERMLSRLSPYAKTLYPFDRLYAFFGLYIEDFTLSLLYRINLEQALTETARSII